MIKVQILRERNYIPGKVGEIVSLDDTIAHRLLGIGYVSVVQFTPHIEQGSQLIVRNSAKAKQKEEKDDE